MRKATAAAFLAVAACATSVPQTRAQQPASDDERAVARAADERSAALEQPLAYAAGQPAPDCRRACDLVEQICDLSRRICEIAARHGDDIELAGRCSSSQERCRRSRARLPADCSCRAP